MEFIKYKYYINGTCLFNPLEHRDSNDGHVCRIVREGRASMSNVIRLCTASRGDLSNVKSFFLFKIFKFFEKKNVSESTR